MRTTTAINYRNQEGANYVEQYAVGEGFDVVFDTVGNESLVRTLFNYIVHLLY